MPLKAKALPKQENKQQFPPQPDMDAGTYPARVVQLIDLGLQPQRAFKNEEKKPANEIMITYEFVDTFMVDEDGNDIEDKPRWNSETLPWWGLDADRAKSTQRYLALDPDNLYDGDFSQVVDTPCNVTVVINKKEDKTYVNIASVTAMRPKDAARCPPLVNPTKIFDLEDPDLDVFNSLPQWIRDKIKGNLEYAGSKLEKLLSEAPKEETPKEEEKPKAAKKPKPAPKEVDDDEDTPY